MSKISGLRNDVNKRTFYKERKMRKRYIHFMSKQNKKAPLILDMYENYFKLFGDVGLNTNREADLGFLQL